MAALKAGKHVVVEKPLRHHVRRGDAPDRAGGEGRGAILTDHTFLYTDAVRKIADMSAKASSDECLYYDSIRINLGLFQSDVNVDLRPCGP